LALAIAVLTASGLWSEPARGQSLDEALALAYEGNPTLKAARAELRAVDEGVPQEMSNWRPRVELNGDVGAESFENEFDEAPDESGSTTPWGVSLDVIQPLYRGGRTEAGVDRAENVVLAQRARLTDVEQTVLFDAATAYMDVWRDEATLRLNINNEKVLQEELAASRDRFEVGEITRTDVAQSESRLARATAERQQAEGDLASSRAVYEEIIGQAPGTLAAPKDLSGLPQSLDETVTLAIENNPDIVAAGFSRKASERAVRQVEGELYPEVGLQGSLSHREEEIGEDTETQRAAILAFVNIPLYQQGFVSSRVREAKQVDSQRRLEIDEARRSSERQAVSAWEVLDTARAQIRSFEAEVTSAEIALDGVRQENLVGARTTLDVLDAEQELLDAQVNLVSAERDHIVAGFAVLAAVGRLTAQDYGLAVTPYDPDKNYRAVRDQWYGTEVTGE
jgi:TolC family type I secretion outer membrane protein